MIKLFYLLFIFSSLGCSTTSKTTHVWPNDNQVFLVDTTNKIKPEINFTPKTNDKRAMRVALLLPFFTNEINFDSIGIKIISIGNSSNLALEYMRGFQIALDSLDRAGVQLNLTIFDSQKDTNRIISFMNSTAVKNADVVIGPINNVGLAISSKLIAPKKQVIFSPLSSSQSIASANPSFVLANAGLKAHCEQLALFINTKYPNKKVIILYRHNKGESEYANYFKSALKSKVIELTEKSDSNLFKITDYLTSIDNNIVIIPSFDEEFVNSISKKLFELTDYYKITLFGMPTWTEMETLQLNYLQKLNTHITTTFYTDDTLKRNIQFKNEYTNKYPSRPNEYTYQGYNLILSIAHLWKQYGDKWFEHIQQPIKGLGIDYDFQAVILNGNLSTDFIENKHVFILSYKNNKLIKEK